MSEKLQFELERSKETIAAEINAIKIQTQNMMLHASAEIGKRLTEAKDLVQHGEWGDWLKVNVDYSQSTANNLMQIHKEYDSNSQTFANLNYSKAIALLGIGSEEREAFVQENNVEEMSTRELQKAIKEKQALEKELAKASQAKAEALQEKVALEKQVATLTQEIANLGETDTEEQQDEVKALRENLKHVQDRADQLEKQLREKPLEATTVEVIPNEVQQELDDLRAKLSEQGDPTVITFRVRFKSLVDEFNATIETLEEIADEETKRTYKTAIHKLMDKMRATLESE